MEVFAFDVGDRVTFAPNSMYQGKRGVYLGLQTDQQAQIKLDNGKTIFPSRDSLVPDVCSDNVTENLNPIRKIRHRLAELKLGLANIPSAKRPAKFSSHSDGITELLAKLTEHPNDEELLTNYIIFLVVRASIWALSQKVGPDVLINAVGGQLKTARRFLRQAVDITYNPALTTPSGTFKINEELSRLFNSTNQTKAVDSSLPVVSLTHEEFLTRAKVARSAILDTLPDEALIDLASASTVAH